MISASNHRYTIYIYASYESPIEDATRLPRRNLPRLLALPLIDLSSRSVTPVGSHTTSGRRRFALGTILLIGAPATTRHQTRSN